MGQKWDACTCRLGMLGIESPTEILPPELTASSQESLTVLVQPSRFRLKGLYYACTGSFILV